MTVDSDERNFRNFTPVEFGIWRGDLRAGKLRELQVLGREFWPLTSQTSICSTSQLTLLDTSRLSLIFLKFTQLMIILSSFQSMLQQVLFLRPSKTNFKSPRYNIPYLLHVRTLNIQRSPAMSSRRITSAAHPAPHFNTASPSL